MNTNFQFKKGLELGIACGTTTNVFGPEVALVSGSIMALPLAESIFSSTEEHSRSSPGELSSLPKR